MQVHKLWQMPFMNRYKYDAFVSHAVEDKIGIANDLCRKLEELGLKIWYSGKSLETAKGLEEQIDEAIHSSRFGVVIFSPTYLEKTWTMSEFHRLWARDGKSKPPVVVIPVFYNITAAQVAEKCLLVGDRYGINADGNIDSIANRIKEAITKETIRVQRVRRVQLAVSVVIGAMMVLSYSFWQKIEMKQLPSSQEVEALLAERVNGLQAAHATLGILSSYSKKSPGQVVDSIYQAFTSFKSYYRNEYHFSNGWEEVRARKHVNATLGIVAQDLRPASNYGMDSATVTILDSSPLKAVYRYTNRAPVVQQVEKIADDGMFIYRTTYENNIRVIEVTLQLPKDTKGTKKHTMSITGLKPVETYEVVLDRGSWKLRELKSEGTETN
jgi:hypothetical protein